MASSQSSSQYVPTAQSNGTSLHRKSIDFLLKHTLKLSHTPHASPPRVRMQLKKTTHDHPFLLQPHLCSLLQKYKNQIDTIQNFRLWDFCKKLTNPFELIHSYDKLKNTNIGIANYNPISRSYFKMWEMIQDFQLLDFAQPHLRF